MHPSAWKGNSAKFVPEVATWQMRRPWGTAYIRAEVGAVLLPMIRARLSSLRAAPRLSHSVRRGLRLAQARR
jgi:hypothetical protein